MGEYPTGAATEPHDSARQLQARARAGSSERCAVLPPSAAVRYETVRVTESTARSCAVRHVDRISGGGGGGGPLGL